MEAKPVPAELRRQIKVNQAEGEVSTRQVADATGINYHRIVRVVNGYAKPRPGELETIRVAIALLAGTR